MQENCIDGTCTPMTRAVMETSVRVICTYAMFHFLGFAGYHDEPWHDYILPPETCNTGTQTEAIEVQYPMLKGMLCIN